MRKYENLRQRYSQTLSFDWCIIPHTQQRASIREFSNIHCYNTVYLQHDSAQR